jgi:predicted nucleic acid-binding protein
VIKHPPRIYWDACAWISYINKEMNGPGSPYKDPRFDMCRETLKSAESGEIEIVTSAFNLAEVCKRKPDPNSPALNLPAFFDQSYILLVPVDKAIGLKAQYLQLSGAVKRKPPDAIHLASALVHSIPVFHTFDDGLLDLDMLLTMDDGNQLRICKPTKEKPTPPLLDAMQRP